MITLRLLVDLAMILLLTTFSVVSVTHTVRARRSQNALAKRADSASPWQPWFRVSLASPGYFMRWLKWTSFETKGIVIVMPEQIRVLARLPSGEHIDWDIPRAALEVEWTGSGGMFNGNQRWWFRINSGSRSFYLTSESGPWSDIRLAREATINLCRALAPNITLPANPAIGYALEKNPASLSVVIAFFALMAYALLDGLFLNSYELVNDGRIRNLGPIMMISALPCYFWLVRRQVPAAESTILTLLLGGVLSFSFYPAAKRLDQLLAAPPLTYQYRLLADHTLAPVNAELPILDFSNSPDYWAQFEIGSTHTFQLLHGPLGLWQVDTTALYEAMKKFYRSRPGNARKQPSGAITDPSHQD